MKTMISRGVCVLMIALAVWAAQASQTAAESGVVRTVQGEVVAVNLQSPPNVIVVKVILPSKQNMIVGTTVGPEVAITKGQQKIDLAQIKTGQTVSVTYVKNSDGLAARSIQVRK